MTDQCEHIAEQRENLPLSTFPTSREGDSHDASDPSSKFGPCARLALPIGELVYPFLKIFLVASVLSNPTPCDEQKQPRHLTLQFARSLVG